MSEYNDWKIQLLPYEKYIENEKKIKEDILYKKKCELFKEIFPKLQPSVKNAILSKTFEEQVNTILDSLDIVSKFDIESFHPEQMKKLKSPSVDRYEKLEIAYCQYTFLKNLGITIPDDMLNCITEESIANYLTFLNQDDIRRFIPSYELIRYISPTRERKYEEALREYYTTRKDFIDAMKLFKNNQKNLECVYNCIKNKNVCILGQGELKMIMNLFQ